MRILLSCDNSPAAYGNYGILEYWNIGSKKCKIFTFKTLKSKRVTVTSYIMPIKKDYVFRKKIFPWYKSKTVYIIVIIFMILVFVFGIIGISVALELAEYNGCIWVPILLVVLSTLVLITSSYHLLKRYLARSSDTFPL